MEDDNLLDLIEKTLDFDDEASSVEKGDQALTFKRDEKGVLWSYDSAGNKVGRVYEHGDGDTEE